MNIIVHNVLCNLATLGPIGHLRPAPGTIGSLIALATGYIIASYNTGLLAATILIFTFLGVIAADRYKQSTGKKDPPEVIIDEVVGQWIPLIIIPIDVYWYFSAFFLFRFFDIFKIGPIAYAETLPGGVGIMADDLIAGILAALVLWFLAVCMEYAI